MEEKTKGISRKSILKIASIGIVLMIVISSVYIFYLRIGSDNLNQKQESSNLNGLYVSGLTLTLSFDQDLYNISERPLINGTLKIINNRPSNISISNYLEHVKGLYINITDPNGFSTIEEFWLTYLLEPIVVESGDELIIPFNLLELDLKYSAPRLFNEDGEYTIHFIYDGVKSNNVKFNLSH